MKALIEKGILSETPCGSNLAYVLNDGSCFSPTDYKMLHGEGNVFVPCFRMLYNGRIQIFYMCDSLRSLSSILSSVTAEGFVNIVKSLLSAVIEVKGNGFLSCQNISIEPDKIFVDPSSFTVKLVYLPLTKSVFRDSAAFESELRASLIRLIGTLPREISSALDGLSRLLADGTLVLGELAKRLGHSPDGGGSSAPGPKRSLRLVGVNSPVPTELKVDKDIYRIGRNALKADGVLDFSRAISRLHCEISLQDGLYYISDLESSGGTSVNRISLAPHRPYPIYTGDEIELAGFVFKVVID